MLGACLAVLAPARVSAATIDFESLLDGEAITTQFLGVTFSNATTLTAGVSLNEFEFPPFSGVNVASDDGGAVRIDFSQPVLNVGAYFTYAEPLVLRAFDGANNLLGSISSAFANNEALAGDAGTAPNELLQLAFIGIAYVTFTGNSDGGSFVFDDLTYEPLVRVTPMPEPSTIGLMASGLIALAHARRR